MTWGGVRGPGKRPARGDHSGFHHPRAPEAAGAEMLAWMQCADTVSFHAE